MFVARRGKMLHVGGFNLSSFLLQLFDCFPHIDGVPGHDGVGHEVQTGSLVELVFRVAFANLRFVGDKEITAQ